MERTHEYDKSGRVKSSVIGKFRNEGQSPTHPFNEVSECREEVGSFFETRDPVLPDP